MPESSDLVFAVEAAEILHVSPRTISRMAKSGRLPVAVQGKGRTTANLYRRADVEALRPDQGGDRDE